MPPRRARIKSHIKWLLRASEYDMRAHGPQPPTHRGVEDAEPTRKIRNRFEHTRDSEHFPLAAPAMRRGQQRMVAEPSGSHKYIVPQNGSGSVASEKVGRERRKQAQSGPSGRAPWFGQFARNGRILRAFGPDERGEKECPDWASWRRGWDSNPRYGLSPYNGLANRRLQPLGHPSGLAGSTI